MAKIIDDPNIQNRITEMQEKHLSSRQIAVELQKDGVKINYATISRYLNDVRQKGIEIISKDPVVNKFVIDIVGNIKVCNKQMLNMVQNMQATKTFKISAIRQLMEITKMVMEYDRSLKQPTGMTIKQAPGSHINFIQDYKLYLKDLESRGDIIIVNPMLKTEPQKPKQPVSKPAEIIDTEIIEEQEEEEKEDDESGEN
jgi:hypothetical protein